MEAFGLPQTLTTAVFCHCTDLAKWSAVNRGVHAAATHDAVWRQMLTAHFASALKHLGESSQLDAVLRRCDRQAHQLYVQLHRVSPAPFVLESRQRLLLEIHELREWDQHEKELILRRQEKIIVDLCELDEDAHQLGKRTAEVAMELMSLMALIGNGAVPDKAACPEIEFAPSADRDLATILSRRIQKRRQWWQKQREFLLQDLNWN